jgi:hypothetical protein
MELVEGHLEVVLGAPYVERGQQRFAIVLAPDEGETRERDVVYIQQLSDGGIVEHYEPGVT